MKRILLSLAAATLAATPALATTEWRVIKVSENWTSFYRKVDFTGDQRRFDTTRIPKDRGYVDGDAIYPGTMDCVTPRFKMDSIDRWITIEPDTNGVRMRRHICS